MQLSRRKILFTSLTLALLVIGGCGKSRAELSQIVAFEQSEYDRAENTFNDYEQSIDKLFEDQIKVKLAIAKNNGIPEEPADLTEEQKLEAPLVSRYYGRLDPIGRPNGVS